MTDAQPQRLLEERLIDWTLELIRIPSVTGNEEQICTHVLALAERLCPQATCHRVGNSAIILPPQQADRPTIGLFGHTDTVKPATDQPVGLIDGAVFGCGASDMKGPLAVMLALLQEVETLQRANLAFIFYDKEEGPNAESGLIPVLASGILPRLDLALCLEPTNNVIQVGCVGSMHAQVIVRGKRAHSARPWQGDSAVTRAIPLLQHIADFAPREVRFGESEASADPNAPEIVFREVMSVTMMQGGINKNVVPDAVELNVNYRFAPGTSPEEAATFLRQYVLESWGQSLPPAGVEVNIQDSAPSGGVFLDEPLLRDWRLRLGIPIEPKQAWTDVARLTALGIPAVNFGPGLTSQAHQAREHVPVSLLVEGYHRLHALLAP